MTHSTSLDFSPDRQRSHFCERLTHSLNKINESTIQEHGWLDRIVQYVVKAVLYPKVHKAEMNGQGKLHRRSCLMRPCTKEEQSLTVMTHSTVSSFSSREHRISSSNQMSLWPHGKALPFSHTLLRVLFSRLKQNRGQNPPDLFKEQLVNRTGSVCSDVMCVFRHHTWHLCRHTRAQLLVWMHRSCCSCSLA